ncbi:MAG TPA: Hsp20/alpha crystallin family protein [Planctomycetaceae bacterium]|nr:Hsp20/alpha crystallin family protein [Planctomycetaceae bacterium]
MRTESPELVNQDYQAAGETERTSSRPVYRPRVDILDTQDAVVLLADLPGVAEDGADVTLEKNVLTIRGSVAPAEDDGLQDVVTEYGIGEFERVFTLTDEIDRSAIEATMKDGVLRVRLPRAREAASRKIDVRAG